MNVKSKSPYHSALLISLCLQVLCVMLTGFLICGQFEMLTITLIPAAAYWIITPIIIFRHPQPTKNDLLMVRSGYFVYLVLTFPVMWAVSTLSR